MRNSTFAWRLGVPCGCIALLALFALLYLRAPGVYFAALNGWGLAPYRFPFLDTHAVLSALVCTQRGFDTYLLNPCDVLTRAFVYSPMMLDAAIFPVSMAWNDWIGVALALLFSVSVASLPAPRGGREWIVMALALLSTMTMFALERGNVDLLIFMLMVGAGHLLMRGPAPRYVGYALILFGGFLKYYPMVTLAVALRERPRRFLVIAIAAIILSLLFVAHYRSGLAEAITRVPDGSYYTDLFGAENLPIGLTALLTPIAAWPAVGMPILVTLPWLLLAVLLWQFGIAAVSGQALSAALPGLRERERLFLAMGALLIVGCFFAGQSIGYRGILFLLVLPGLLALARRPDGRKFRLASWLIVFLMWGEMFREALAHLSLGDPLADQMLQIVRVAFWLIREVIWWRAIGTLAALLVAFAMTSEMGTWMMAKFSGLRRVPL